MRSSEEENCWLGFISHSPSSLIAFLLFSWGLFCPAVTAKGLHWASRHSEFPVPPWAEGDQWSCETPLALPRRGWTGLCCHWEGGWGRTTITCKCFRENSGFSWNQAPKYLYQHCLETSLMTRGWTQAWGRALAPPALPYLWIHPVGKRKCVFTLHAKMLLFARCLWCLLLLILHCVPASQQCHNLQHQGSIWCRGSKTCCRKKGACTAQAHWWKEMFSCCGFNSCLGRFRLSACSHLQWDSWGWRYTEQPGKISEFVGPLCNKYILTISSWP